MYKVHLCSFRVASEERVNRKGYELTEMCEYRNINTRLSINVIKVNYWVNLLTTSCQNGWERITWSFLAHNRFHLLQYRSDVRWLCRLRLERHGYFNLWIWFKEWFSWVKSRRESTCPEQKSFPWLFYRGYLWSWLGADRYRDQVAA